MLNWLRNLLRKWLLEERQEEPSKILEVIFDGEIKKAFVCGCIGMRLHCSIPYKGGSISYLVSENQAVDQEHFKRLWESFQDPKMKLIWEGDSPKL